MRRTKKASKPDGAQRGHALRLPCDAPGSPAPSYRYSIIQAKAWAADERAISKSQ
jgi:hypothetical protein